MQSSGTLQFAPLPSTMLTLDGVVYHFLPHPALPPDLREVYVVEGAEALIYPLATPDGAYHALKALKPPFRSPRVEAVTRSLAHFAATTGFAAARRVCLTPAAYPSLIASFPDLAYAQLMPWIEGISWAGLLLDRRGSAAYDGAYALALAGALAQALWQLEGSRAAHGDLAGANLMLRPDGSGIELLDLEGLVAPGLPRPSRVSQGTRGYQHPHLGPEGQWRADGDRFAAAILLTELLVWHDVRVRGALPPDAETLFTQRELGDPASPMLPLARAVLYATLPPALALFDRAWNSRDLRECPELSDWALLFLRR